MAASSLRSTGSSNCAIRYIYELPYTEFSKVCKLLDVDGKWRDIGGIYFDMMTLDEFSRAIYRGESPSAAMLTRWGQSNGTINRLFIELSKIKYLRAMQILKPYVSSKYHSLLDENNTTQTYDTNSCAFSRYERSRINSSWNVSRNHGIPCNSVKGPFQDISLPSGKQHMLHKQNYRNIDFDREKEPVEANIPSDCLNSSPVKEYLSNSSKLNGSFDVSSRHGKSNSLTKPTLNCLKDPNSKFPCCSLGGQRDPKCSSSLDIKIDPAPPYKESIPPYKESVPPYKDPVPPYKESPKDSLPVKKVTDEIHNIKDASVRRKMSPSDPQSFPSFSVICQVNYKELQKATNDFQSTVLGRGGFGIVYKGKWRNTDVAIKKIEKKENPGSTNVEEAKLQQSLVELKTLEAIRHDNILNLYAYCLNDNTLCLIYQLMDSSLEDRLLMKDPSKPPLTWFDRCKVARGASCGIQFLHSNSERPLIHGDIKSANILLDKNLEPKIGDFGLVREGPLDEKTHTYVHHVNGTQPYLPHEYLREHKLSTKVDTYSFGVVLFELATGRRAFDPNRPPNRRYLIRSFHGSNRDKIDHLCDSKAGERFQHLFQTFVDQGQTCTQPDRKDRPEMSQVYQVFESNLLILEVLKKYDKETLMQKLSSHETTPLERQIIVQMLQCQPSYNRDGQYRVQEPARHRQPVHVCEYRQPPSIRPSYPLNQNNRVPVQQTDVTSRPNFQFQEKISQPLQTPEIVPSNEKPPSYAEAVNDYKLPSFAPPPQSNYFPPSINPLQDCNKQYEDNGALYLPKITELGVNPEPDPNPSKNEFSNTTDSKEIVSQEGIVNAESQASHLADPKEDTEDCLSMDPPFSPKGVSLNFLLDEDNGIIGPDLSDLMKDVNI